MWMERGRMRKGLDIAALRMWMLDVVGLVGPKPWKWGIC